MRRQNSHITCTDTVTNPNINNKSKTPKHKLYLRNVMSAHTVGCTWITKFRSGFQMYFCHKLLA